MAKHITLTHLQSAVQAVKAYIDTHIKSHTHTRSQITDFPTSMTPTSHASTATTYGAGSGSSYGHVKLSDSATTTSGASSGVAATPTAVKTAYDLANGKAAKSHTHAIADVSNLQSKLDDKLSKTDDINIDGGTF